MSVHRGVPGPGGWPGPGGVPGGDPRMATAAGGTQPTGMHSCLANFFPENCMKLEEIVPRGGAHCWDYCWEYRHVTVTP